MQCNTLYYSTYYLTYQPHNLYHLSLPKQIYLYTQSWIHKFSEEVAHLKNEGEEELLDQRERKYEGLKDMHDEPRLPSIYE